DLAQFVQELGVEELPPDYMKRLGDISFPRLVTLRARLFVVRDDSDEVVVRTMQTLLRCPLLQCVTIYCYFQQREDFLRMWDGCSDSIRHLAYASGTRFDFVVEPSDAHTSRQRRPIKLVSFHSVDSCDRTGSWLLDPSCPFDVSGLKAFRFDKPLVDPLATILAPALESLELFSTGRDDNRRDLSPYSRLVQLDMDLSLPIDSNFRLIRTILPENRSKLRVIRFHAFQLYRDNALKLANKLSSIHHDFPNLRIVQIVVLLPNTQLEKNWKRYFRKLDPGIDLQWEFRGDERQPWYTKVHLVT
ncbi:hypothetical protein FB45DRAFT_927824, partial [Roridomyces roridus]